MRNQPLSKSVTQRMLRQATVGRTDTVARYLRAFGVSDVTLGKIPAVFKAEFNPEWKAFLSANKELHGDPAQRALMATLSFIRYCQALKIDPFVPDFDYRDPLNNTSRVNITKIRKSLTQSELDTLFRAVKADLAKIRFDQSLVVTKTKHTLATSGKDSRLVSVYVMEPASKRQPLDMVLKGMEGTLYSKDVPPQLTPMMSLDKKLDRRPPADALLSGLGTIGWYPVSRNTSYSIWLIRAQKNRLVLKIILNMAPESKDNGDVPLKERLKMWSKFKLLG